MDTYTPPEEKVELCCEDTCEDDEPLFLDVLLKDECDHSDKKTYVKNFKCRVSFERRKLDLSIFTFNEPTNDQSFEIIFQGPLTDQSFENLFKDKLKCLDESIRDAFVSYTPSKEIVNSNFEEMYEDELKILSIHVVYAPKVFFDDDDEFMKRERGKKSGEN